jgi:hypothetical protein
LQASHNAVITVVLSFTVAHRDVLKNGLDVSRSSLATQKFSRTSTARMSSSRLSHHLPATTPQTTSHPNTPHYGIRLNDSDGSFTGLAKDCGHVIHYSVPGALELRLSRTTRTHSEPADWDPADFVYVSTNTFLCAECEQAMHDEREHAKWLYQFIYDNCKGDINEEGFSGPNRVAAAQYHRSTTLRVVNFEDRMADRTNTILQAEAVAARQKKWEAAKKVSFAVEEGAGPGEKQKRRRKEKKVPLVQGPASDSAISLPMRGKEHS